MKKILALCLVAAMLLCGCGAAANGGASGNAQAGNASSAENTVTGTEITVEQTIPLEAAKSLTKPLVILHTNDIHCGVDDGWGYASVYAAKRSLAEDNDVLLVDAGDHLQGAPIGMATNGSALIDLMNVAGYDVAAPGNHDFDYGADYFVELTGKANFPYVCCNLTKNGEPVFAPYVIKEVEGLKIAFVGITTPTSLTASVPKHFQDEQGNTVYSFDQDQTGEKLYKAVQTAVDAAKAEGAAVVIAIAHLGNDAHCWPWTYTDVIANTTGIDAMVDGHSHDIDMVTMKNKDGKSVIRTSTGTKLANIGALTLDPAGTLTAQRYKWPVEIGAPKLLKLDNAEEQAVQTQMAQLDETLQQVVGTTPVDLVIYDPNKKMDDGTKIRIVRNSETNLGDLITDAYLAMAPEADIAFINGGNLRSEIKKGNITVNDLLLVQPFGNNVSVIEATGQQILDALEWGVNAHPSEFGGFIHVAGMSYKIDSDIESPCQKDADGMFTGIDESKPRRVSDVMVGDQPIDPKATYKVVGSDTMLLEHLDGYTMFEGSKVLYPSFIQDIQLLVDYFKKIGGVVGEEYEDPYGQGRITAK